MKVLEVNEKCNGCGLCIINCEYLYENIDGNAEFIAGGYIAEKDLQKVEKVIAECPQVAIILKEEKSTAKRGIDGAKEVIENLKKQVDSIKIIRNSDLKFNVENYYIPIPRSSKAHRSDYSSESQARSVARDEFSRLCYSESAYRPILKKIFVEYKVNVLRPYYDCQDSEGNIYYEYNKQVRELLARTYAELNSLLGDTIPESWKNFSVYFSNNDWEVKILSEFDERSTQSGIISEMKSISYTSLDDYVDEMDFDYYEAYAGEGLFGHTKYKEKWSFKDFDKAAGSFIRDLKWAISYQSSEIQEGAVSLVDDALNSFEKKIKDELKKKIVEIEKIV